MYCRIIKRSASLAVVLLGLTFGTVQAADGEPTAMPLGGAASAPTGFVDLCARTPVECVAVARPTETLMSEVRTWAGRARWSAVFEGAGVASAPAAMPAATVARPVVPVVDPDPGSVAAGDRSTAGRGPLKPTSRDIRALKDERRKHRTFRPLKTPARAAPSAPAAGEAPVVSVAEVSMERLEAVSRRVNRAIRRASDADAYGRADLWVSPQGRDAVGDCEDYVLAKRRLLIEDGVDPAAMSIAIVRTRAGELHAVLLVATADGERVLDNLTPWVLRWDVAPYEWLERQAPGQPLVWVEAATRPL